MKKLKAAVPTVCYTVLLLAIALLSFLIAGKSGTIPTSAQNNVFPTEKQEFKEPAEKNEITLYDDVFPRKSVDETQKIYGDGNVRLHEALQTPVANYVILSSDCKNGDISSSKPVTAVVKLNSENDVISSYQLSTEETYVAVRQTSVGLVLVTESADKKYASLHVISYDLIGETHYKIPATSTVIIIPTEKNFVLFATHGEECTAYTLLDGKLIFQSLGKYSPVDLFEYEETYLLFCNEPLGGTTALITDKNSLIVREKRRLSNEKLLFVKPTAVGVLTVEQGEKTCARVYSTDLSERKEEKQFGYIDVTKTFRVDHGVVVSSNGAECLVIYDDLTSELPETSDKILLDVAYVNGSDRLLFKDTSGNIFFDNQPPFTQAEKVIVLPDPNDSITVVTEKSDTYSFIEITVLSY